MAEGMMLRCEQVRDEAAGIRAFTLRLLDPLGSDRLEPGRYLSLDCPDPGGQVRSRCYSIVARPTLDTIEVVIKRGGHNGVSDRLFQQVQPGSTLSGGAIDGDITASRLLHHGQVVMLANGIGATLPIALIRSMAGLREQGRPTPRVSLLLCNPTLASIPFLAELLRLDLANDWFNVRFHITREPIDRFNGHFYAGRPCAQDLRALGMPGAVVICGGHEFALGQQALAAQVYREPEILVEAFSAPTRSVVEAGEGRALLCIGDQGIELPVDRGSTLLDELERHGVPMRSQCRSGICGSCRVKVVEGKCRREADFTLSSAERAEGFALACCTYADDDRVAILLQ